MNYLLEIATSDFSTTASAVRGGADRIELCASLPEGGTTPSYGTIRQCREAFSIPLFPMVRPRGGDFLYTADEFEIMRQEVRLCKDLGCDGIVLGLLLPDGAIDIARTAQLVELAYPMEVTFHRAFDRCREPEAGMEALISAGCQRLLTSGQQPTAMEGMGLLQALTAQAAGRISVMPGSGIRAANIGVIRAGTGATEFHSSVRGSIASAMDFRHPAFTEEESFTNAAISEEEVSALLAALYRGL